MTKRIPIYHVQVEERTGGIHHFEIATEEYDYCDQAMAFLAKHGYHKHNLHIGGRSQIGYSNQPYLQYDKE